VCVSFFSFFFFFVFFLFFWGPSVFFFLGRDRWNFAHRPEFRSRFFDQGFLALKFLFVLPREVIFFFPPYFPVFPNTGAYFPPDGRRTLVSFTVCVGTLECQLLRILRGLFFRSPFRGKSFGVFKLKRGGTCVFVSTSVNSALSPLLSFVPHLPFRVCRTEEHLRPR